MKILVINGPNINFLGIREVEVYGNKDYNYLRQMVRKKAAQENIILEFFQSNHEGAIIDKIQESYSDYTDAIIINPGAYAYYSYAIYDALISVPTPKVEVHIADITHRAEEWRRHSITAAACNKFIKGRGFEGYLDAIDYLIDLKKNSDKDE